MTDDVSKRDHAVRAKALLEAAANLLYLATLEAIGAVGHLDKNTQAMTEVRQLAEQLLPRADDLIRSLAP